MLYVCVSRLTDSETPGIEIEIVRWNMMDSLQVSTHRNHFVGTRIRSFSLVAARIGVNCEWKSSDD